ncbi:hypothetical protein [Geodermatophilus nigrescens]|uniref:Uncharacterized protein n=1 Tax=Geodermatophilus nigrescens TaxID=1070870 RepID=A0A1M5E1A1_9ACTN|nr:hypothetical protein [Geodermatophilus nigrescens]SHF73048.1 hypothetical protein SAMN05444351_0616 [Geodermatophilus nigrescens]
MATSVLDAPLPTTADPQRRPAAVLLLAAVCMLEAVGLLAGALTGLDGLMTATPQPPGLLVAAALGGLAAWIVLCAAGGLAALDGSGHRLPAGVACGEIVLLAALAVLAVGSDLALPTTLPLPALLLLALAVPVGKLMLTSAPATVAWTAAGPRRRPAEPPVTHPRTRLVTVVLIGLALGALAVSTPVGTDAGTGAPASSTAPRS